MNRGKGLKMIRKCTAKRRGAASGNTQWLWWVSFIFLWVSSIFISLNVWVSLDLLIQVLRIWESPHPSTKLILLQQGINSSGFVHLTSLGNTQRIFLGEFGFRGLAALLLSWLINTIWIKCNPLAALGVGKPPRSEINPPPSPVNRACP